MAKWYWSGPDYNEVGKLEIDIPERNGRAGVNIKARVEDCDGDSENWQVWEDGVMVACGDGPSNGDAKINAEHVVCHGASQRQRVYAAALREANPDWYKPFETKKRIKPSWR